MLYRLSLTVGIFCFVEIFVHLTDGTRPNYIPPWGHYVASVAVMGFLLLGVAWLSRPAEVPADPVSESQAPAVPLPSPRVSSKKSRRRRRV